jgi:pre-60S factor REI1
MTTSATSSSFTCASCRVIFTNVEDQRSHYQSEWHRYNLRRKVADRPPVTEQAYHLKVQTASDNQTATLEAQQEASKSRECLACRKTFASAAAYENHLNSKKHIESAGKYAESDKVVRIIESGAIDAVPKSFMETEISLPENATDADIDAAIEIHMASSKSRLEVSDCLYCPSRFDSMEDCINHMHLQHSFYIPDIDYLKDLPGLMRHLADKVSVWHVCLSCGSESRQPFPSLESVRRHMLDKGHNKIRYDEEGSAELADFFDYSNLMKGSRTTVAVAIDSTEAAELDDFVTDDEYEYEGGEDNIDDDSLILAPDESELILPNGVRLGARAYRRYYRQNLMPYLDQESRPNSLRAINAPRPDGTVVRGQHYVPAPKVLTQVEKKGIKQEHYDRKNFALKMGIKGNGLQTYYREQLLQ